MLFAEPAFVSFMKRADFQLGAGRCTVVLCSVGHRDRGRIFRDSRCRAESFAGACDVYELFSKRGSWRGARSDRGGCCRRACIRCEGGARATDRFDGGGRLPHRPGRTRRGAVHFQGARRRHGIESPASLASDYRQPTIRACSLIVFMHTVVTVRSTPGKCAISRRISSSRAEISRTNTCIT